MSEVSAQQTLLSASASTSPTQLPLRRIGGHNGDESTATASTTSSFYALGDIPTTPRRPVSHAHHQISQVPQDESQDTESHAMTTETMPNMSTNSSSSNGSEHSNPTQHPRQPTHTSSSATITTLTTLLQRSTNATSSSNNTTTGYSTARPVSAMFANLSSLGSTSVRRTQPLLPALAAAASTSANHSATSAAALSPAIVHSSLPIPTQNAIDITLTLPKPEILPGTSITTTTSGNSISSTSDDDNPKTSPTLNQTSSSSTSASSHPTHASPRQFWMSFTPMVGNQSKSTASVIANSQQRVASRRQVASTLPSTTTTNANSNGTTNANQAQNVYSAQSNTQHAPEFGFHKEALVATPALPTPTVNAHDETAFLRHRGPHYFSPKVLSPGQPLSFQRTQNYEFDTNASEIVGKPREQPPRVRLTGQILGGESTPKVTNVASQSPRNIQTILQTNLPLPNMPLSVSNTSLLSTVSVLSPSSPDVVGLKSQFISGSSGAGRSPVRRSLIPPAGGLESPAFGLMKTGVSTANGASRVLTLASRLTKSTSGSGSRMDDETNMSSGATTTAGGLNTPSIPARSTPKPATPSHANVTPPPSARRLRLPGTQQPVATPDYPMQVSVRPPYASHASPPSKWSSTRPRFTSHNSRGFPQYDHDQTQLASPGVVIEIPAPLIPMTTSANDTTTAGSATSVVSTADSATAGLDLAIVPVADMGTSASEVTDADVSIGTPALDLCPQAATGAKAKTTVTAPVMTTEAPIRTRYSTRYGAHSLHQQAQPGQHHDQNSQHDDASDAATSSATSTGTTSTATASLTTATATGVQTRLTRSQQAQRENAAAETQSQSDASPPDHYDKADTNTASSSQNPPGSSHLASNATAGVHVIAQNDKPKPCHCKKSRCLKLYCECFARRGYCVGCNCACCQNTPDHEEARERAIRQTLERDPNAFFRSSNGGLVGESAEASVEGSGALSLGGNLITPTASSANPVDNQHMLGPKHKKGCNCKKSGCLKKYCECYQSGVSCGAHCKCSDCKNCQDNTSIAPSGVAKSSNPVSVPLYERGTVSGVSKTGLDTNHADEDESSDSRDDEESLESSETEQDGHNSDNAEEDEEAYQAAMQERALAAQNAYLLQHQEQLAKAAHSVEFIPGLQSHEEEEDLIGPGVNHITKPQANTLLITRAPCVLAHAQSLHVDPNQIDADCDGEDRPVVTPTSSSAGAASSTILVRTISAGGAPMVPAGDMDAYESDVAIDRRRYTRPMLSVSGSETIGEKFTAETRGLMDVSGVGSPMDASSSWRSAAINAESISTTHMGGDARFPSLVTKMRDIELLNSTPGRPRSQRLASRRDDVPMQSSPADTLEDQTAPAEVSAEAEAGPGAGTGAEGDNEAARYGRQRVTRRVTRLTRTTGGEPALPDSSSSSSHSASSSPVTQRKRGSMSSEPLTTSSPVLKKVLVNPMSTAPPTQPATYSSRGMRTRGSGSIATH